MFFGKKGSAKDDGWIVNGEIIQAPLRVKQYTYKPAPFYSKILEQKSSALFEKCTTEIKVLWFQVYLSLQKNNLNDFNQSTAIELDLHIQRVTNPEGLFNLFLYLRSNVITTHFDFMLEYLIFFSDSVNNILIRANEVSDNDKKILIESNQQLKKSLMQAMLRFKIIQLWRDKYIEFQETTAQKSKILYLINRRAHRVNHLEQTQEWFSFLAEQINLGELDFYLKTLDMFIQNLRHLIVSTPWLDDSYIKHFILLYANYRLRIHVCVEAFVPVREHIRAYKIFIKELYKTLVGSVESTTKNAFKTKELKRAQQLSSLVIQLRFNHFVYVHDEQSLIIFCKILMKHYYLQEFCFIKDILLTLLAHVVFKIQESTLFDLIDKKWMLDDIKYFLNDHNDDVPNEVSFEFIYPSYKDILKYLQKVNGDKMKDQTALWRNKEIELAIFLERKIQISKDIPETLKTESHQLLLQIVEKYCDYLTLQGKNPRQSWLDLICDTSDVSQRTSASNSLDGSPREEETKILISMQPLNVMQRFMLQFDAMRSTKKIEESNDEQEGLVEAIKLSSY